MRNLILLIFNFIFVNTFSQNTAVFYNIKQSCKEISLGAVVDKKYYQEYTTLLENKVENSSSGKFDVKTNDKFPLPYSFICKQNNGFKPSALFTLSKDNLNFKLDSIGMFMPVLPIKNKNSALIDDQYKFNLVFSKLLNVFNNKEEDNLKLDSLLLNFSKKNPNSYMLFWTLVQYSQFNGFKDSYLKSFNNLSPKIKNSIYGKIFYSDISNYLKLSEKSKFPNLDFQNRKIYSSLGKKYTLIDFWFSHCEPCLYTFPKYKDHYNLYKNKGLEIIGISTDQTKSIDAWKKVIKEKDLSWNHYLDENGIESKKYGINSFPTTFLLDSDGTIIKKDISPEELEIFLKQNLK